MATRPPSTMRIEMTDDRIGRSMKKCVNIAAPQRLPPWAARHFSLAARSSATAAFWSMAASCSRERDGQHHAPLEAVVVGLEGVGIGAIDAGERLLHGHALGPRARHDAEQRLAELHRAIASGADGAARRLHGRQLGFLGRGRRLHGGLVFRHRGRFLLRLRGADLHRLPRHHAHHAVDDHAVARRRGRWRSRCPWSPT